MKKKSLLVVCIAIVIIASIAIAQTIAYFSDTATATNVFTVGDVKIALTEPNWDATKAKLVPNREIAKDPTVTVVANSEDCYVRMLVTITNSAEWDVIFDGKDSILNYLTLGTGWTDKGNTVNATDNTRTYELWYSTKVASSTTDTVLPALFTALKVPDMDNDQVATLAGFEIIVTAQAIQAESFTDAAAAWAAWN